MSPPSVRASVERGDPLSIYRKAGNFRRGHLAGTYAMLTPQLDGYSALAFHESCFAASAAPPEPDPPQAVTADPQPFDTEPDGVYGHAMERHPVEFASEETAATGEAIEVAEGAAPGFDRLAFLARVQRIDPERR